MPSEKSMQKAMDLFYANRAKSTAMGGGNDADDWQIERIAAAMDEAVAEERESCAMEAEDYKHTGLYNQQESAAAAIRARGEKAEEQR